MLQSNWHAHCVCFHFDAYHRLKNLPPSRQNYNTYMYANVYINIYNVESVYLCEGEGALIRNCHAAGLYLRVLMFRIYLHMCVWAV